MFTLETVVPWGRTYDEYCRMFALGERELERSILGCGDGPASFNAEATERGVRVVSFDPLYRLSAGEIEARIAATSRQVIEQTRANADEFVWKAIPSIDALIRIRQSAMRRFLEDYEEGRAAGRYVDAELPALPFPDATFDLALCSHLLFLYSTQLDEAFHVRAVRDLCRVAREVRIFPLLALGGRPSPHVKPVMAALGRDGFDVSIETVGYEFVRGGNQMLRIARPEPVEGSR
jgi:SAM-dependent methyltransferase